MILIQVINVSHFSCVQLFVTPCTVAHQAPLSMGILQGRILEWVAMPSSRGDLSQCRQVLYCLSHHGSPRILEWVDLLLYPYQYHVL